MTIMTHKKGISDIYATQGSSSDLKVRINYVKGWGGDLYLTFLVPSKVAAMRTSGDKTYYQNAINYAHSQGMKIKLTHNISWYPRGTSGAGTKAVRQAFETNLTAQQQFLDDLLWAVTNLTGLDGIELEEPHSWDYATSHLAFWKAFHLKCYNKIKSFLDTHLNFDWGFNFINNSDSVSLNQGIDINYLNTNKIFRNVYVQAFSETLTGFQSIINRYKPKFTNIEMGVYNYYSSSTYIQGCTVPSCYNQAMFENMKYAHQNGIPYQYFYMGSCFQTISYYPGNTALGATVGAAMKTIWTGAATPPPPPPPQPTVETDPSKIVMALAGVGGLLYILDKEI